ncbi:MAG: CDP-alcohol phosphatidyltransferase family protein [bacterium]
MYFLFKKNSLFKESIKLRPVEELFNINLYRPLAFLILIILLKLKNNIKPEFIVVFHTILIFISSFLILVKDNDYINFIIFFLINLKIVLDNLDGQYSRIRKLESELGRYLDTIMDFFGNLALFLSIGIKYNQLFLSILSFFLFTIILSYDFNLEYLYRATRGEKFRTDIKDSPSFLLKLLKKIYEIFLEPQDRFIRYFENKVFEIIYAFVNKFKKKIVF